MSPEPVLEAVAQLLPGALCCRDAALKLAFFNAPYAELYARLAGRPPQLGELPANYLADPALRAQVAECWRRATCGEPVVMRHTLRLGERPESWETRYQPVRDADGQVIGALAWGKKCDGAAHEAAPEKAFLRTFEGFFSQLPDMVIVTEAWPIDAAEGGPRIIYVNESFERATGYSRSEVIGQTPRILQGPRTQRDQLDKIRAALERQQPTRVELVNYRKDGREFVADITLAPVTDESGKAICYVALQRDITQEKALVARLNDALAERDILLQEIHHRLKNNLQMVISLLELHAAERHRYTLDELIENARARVLAVALIHEQLCQQSNFTCVPLDGLLRALIEQAQVAYASGPVAVALTPSGLPLPFKQAVPAMLIAHELLANSFKHGVAAGAQRVAVHIRRSPDALTIEVTDDGARHPADISARLADDRRLGLRLARLLARQLNGTLSFDPQPGCFRAALSFPFAETAK